MTPLEALQMLTEFDCSVQIRKLSRVTLLSDCSPELWKFIGLSRSQVYPIEGKRPQVSDLPFDIWICQIGLNSGATKRSTAYGKSFAEAVERASAIF